MRYLFRYIQYKYQRKSGISYNLKSDDKWEVKFETYENIM